MMNQVNILLAWKVKFLQSCAASGSYAASSIMRCAHLCSPCLNSLSPTAAPCTNSFPPWFSTGLTCDENTLTSPSPSKTSSAAHWFHWRGPTAAGNLFRVEHWAAAASIWIYVQYSHYGRGFRAVSLPTPAAGRPEGRRAHSPRHVQDEHAALMDVCMATSPNTSPTDLFNS